MSTSSRDDAFVILMSNHRELLDLWAVWPDDTECSLKESRELESLLTWKSDDYQIRAAISYDASGSPIYGEVR